MAVQTSVLVTPNAAFAGMLADAVDLDIVTSINADTASIPFGAVVALYPSAGVGDKGVKLPATSADNLWGIVVHKHDYSRTYTLPDGTVAGYLDSVGLVPGTGMSVIRRGHIWVQVLQAVTAGDHLFVSYAVGTPFAAKGQSGNAAVASTTIDATRIGEFLTSASAGGFAVLDVSFGNRNS